VVAGCERQGERSPTEIEYPATARSRKGPRGLAVVVGRIWSGFFTPPFSRGALYALLSNPVTSARSHKGARYPGQHEAILDRATWDSVQDQLRTGAPERHGPAAGPRSPLIGKFFDEAGHRLTPSHATKAGRRYRYYVSRPLVTETAEQIPGLISGALKKKLGLDIVSEKTDRGRFYRISESRLAAR
jgi:hypothetical protein